MADRLRQPKHIMPYLLDGVINEAIRFPIVVFNFVFFVSVFQVSGRTV